MSRPFGVAIIGCGVIGPLHAEAYASLPEARLVGFSDPHLERAQGLQARFGGVAEEDYRALLRRDDVDVVSLCTPSGSHADLVVEAARAGKHVLCEKPLDISLARVDRAIAACREDGVTLGVVFQHRFDPASQQVHELVRTGRLGRLFLGNAVVQWYRTQEYYDAGGWRGTYAMDGGGALINQSIHTIDLLRWMMGPPRRVYGRTLTASHAIEAEDVGLAIVEFESGALGTIQGTTSAYPGLSTRLEFFGTGGTAVIEDDRLERVDLQDEQAAEEAAGSHSGAWEARDPAGVGTSDPAAVGWAAHRAQIADFLDALQTARPPLVGGQEARDALELVLAVYASAREGRPMDVPILPS
ncbi:Gfo/Idh/MocA family protein [Limnochorda pilosa]|uniref:Oxidoreductase n=1 Tax=Limnochorda pilosa TaxID=1555112 RepID=A0A0K2SIE0_LIMPI|nr:Gfo/Idh/MocA family oxidoreductase [Limnochorda pilosa]BAS26873.1 oxidoreductase [Limnochorda pilosa]